MLKLRSGLCLETADNETVHKEGTVEPTSLLDNAKAEQRDGKILCRAHGFALGGFVGGSTRMRRPGQTYNKPIGIGKGGGTMSNTPHG